MRSVIFRYEDIAALSAALSETTGALPLPAGETVTDGEWVLAIFEIGSRRRATATAARGVRAAGDTHLEFERRDWERLVGFVAARSEHMRAAKPISTLPASSSEAPRPSGPVGPVRAVSSGRIPAASSGNVPIAISSSRIPISSPEAEGNDAPPRSRRGASREAFDEIPPSSAIESSRIPFGARILVIDESRGSGDELRAMLAEMGLIVELVTTTRRAEERMRAQTFDAVVIDMNVAGGDSHAFVGKVRANARIADMPILLVSNKPKSRDVVDAFASGCDDFLPKPFRTPELAARIFGLLRRARMVRGALGSSGR